MSRTPAPVIFEDNHLLVVDKPSGLATAHADGDQESLDLLLKEWLRQRDAKPGNVFLGIVHRIDRPVSGVVLFAKTSKAAARVGEQFREGTAQKTYWALVQPAPVEDQGIMEDYLASGPGEHGGRRAWVTSAGDPEGKLAITEWSVRKRLGKQAWVELHPKTGRTHQLRVQLGTRGHPILGDDRYGASRRFDWGIALHARSLEITHPIDRGPRLFTSATPTDWLHAFGKGWNFPTNTKGMTRQNS